MLPNLTAQCTNSFLPLGTSSIRLRREEMGRLRAPGMQPLCGWHNQRQLRSVMTGRATLGRWRAPGMQPLCGGGRRGKPTGGGAGGKANKQQRSRPPNKPTCFQPPLTALSSPGSRTSITAVSGPAATASQSWSALRGDRPVQTTTC